MKFFKLFVLMAAAVAATQAMAAGDAEAGKAKAAPCAACHGQDGNKTLTGTYPKLAGQGEEYLVKQLENFKSGTRENAVMQGQVAGMSEQDMQDVAAFYASLTPEAGQASADWVESSTVVATWPTTFRPVPVAMARRVRALMRPSTRIWLARTPNTWKTS